jgi:hypothetical protein
MHKSERNTIDIKLKMYNLIVKILVYLITGYQHVISPNLPKACRFHPTCSEYSKEALLKYGLLKGMFLSVKRILRCNQFFHGGYDPLIESRLKK